MPADPNRRAKATLDVFDAILDRWPEPEKPATDPGVGRARNGEQKPRAARCVLRG